MTDPVVQASERVVECAHHFCSSVLVLTVFFPHTPLWVRLRVWHSVKPENVHVLELSCLILTANKGRLTHSDAHTQSQESERRCTHFTCTGILSPYLSFFFLCSIWPVPHPFITPPLFCSLCFIYLPIHPPPFIPILCLTLFFYPFLGKSHTIPAVPTFIAKPIWVWGSGSKVQELSPHPSTITPQLSVQDRTTDNVSAELPRWVFWLFTVDFCLSGEATFVTTVKCNGLTSPLKKWVSGPG